MEQGAAWLCERVLPPVPLRQWVLSLPRALRYLLAYDGKLLRAVSSAAMREVFRFLRLRARKVLGLLSTRHALPGALIAVQRFGSSLNLNIHFHSLVLDGVYARDAFGTPTFFELPPPTLEDLNRVVARVAKPCWPCSTGAACGWRTRPTRKTPSPSGVVRSQRWPGLP